MLDCPCGDMNYMPKILKNLNDKLSAYDLILMKDLLNHLSNKDIKKSNSKYLLLNNYNLKKNSNNPFVRAPFWININWKISPWNLNVIDEFKSDGKDKDYILVKI